MKTIRILWPDAIVYTEIKKITVVVSIDSIIGLKITSQIYGDFITWSKFTVRFEIAILILLPSFKHCK